MPSTVGVHVGMHKTGTKTIQAFLAVNAPLFEEQGVLIARAGRVPFGDGLFSPGNHRIAWELLTHDTSPSFVDLLAELRGTNAPLGMVSSEDFSPLFTRPTALHHLADGFASIGFRPKIVLYLRSQAAFAESLYAEYAKAGSFSSFESFLETILERGSYAPEGSPATISFAYGTMIDAFESIFGRENMVVRDYRSTRDPQLLLRDYLEVIATFRGGLSLNGLQNPMPFANDSVSFRTLLHKITSDRFGARADSSAGVAANIMRRFPDLEIDRLDARFDLLTHADRVRFLERFRAENAQINARYGLALPGAEDALPPADAVRERRVARHRAVLRHVLEAAGRPD